MTAEVDSFRRIRILIGTESNDISAPAQISVREALATCGIPGWQDVVVVDDQGRAVLPEAAIGQACPDGGLLAVLDPYVSTGARRARPNRHAVGTTSMTPIALTLATALALGCSVIIWIGNPAHPVAPGHAMAVGLALVAVGLTLAILRSGIEAPGGLASPTGPASRIGWSIDVAAPLLAGAGTAIAVAAGSHADLSLPAELDSALALTGGLCAAAMVATGRYALGRRSGQGAVAATIAQCWSLLASLAIVALATGQPLATGAIVLAGFAPLALRMLPAGSLQVPAEQLLDTEVPRSGVHDITGARQRMVAGTVAISVLAPIGIGLLWAGGPTDPIERWAALVASGAVVIALWAHPRTAGSLTCRIAPRLAAAAIVITCAMTFRGVGTLGIGLSGVGVVVAVVAIASSRGWRSVAWSRIADGIELVATVVALPAGLVAAGMIDLIRSALAR